LLRNRLIQWRLDAAEVSIQTWNLEWLRRTQDCGT
jgi:hypothetical protein